MNYKTTIHKLLFLFLIGFHVIIKSQQGWDVKKFSELSFDERYRYIHDFPYWKINDSKILNHILTHMYTISKNKDDIHSRLAVIFHFCKAAANTTLPNKKTSQQFFQEMKELSVNDNFPIEEVVANHYLNNDLDNKQNKSVEQQYIDFQKTYDNMESLGFSKFKDYNVEDILLNLTQFMWELGDYEKALKYLTVAERYIIQTEAGGYDYTQVLSYLQTYWKQKKNYEKSLYYAEKILAYHQKFKTNDEMRHWWNRFWLGFSNIEIADLMIKQNKIIEAEKYADKGYYLSKSDDKPINEIVNFQAEFDALNILIGIKMKLGKNTEVSKLLQRTGFLKKTLEAKNQLGYFKPIKYYQYLSEYKEKSGDYSEALIYNRLAQKLEDSLNKKNDSFKLSQAQQRFDAEKFSKKIELVEKDKKLNKLLLYFSIIILLMVIFIGYLNHQNISERHKQKELQLSSAKNELEHLAQDFKNKSLIIENLKTENIKLSEIGEKSEYIEELVGSTILTDEDWLKFKKTFEKVYPNFIDKQKKEYPNITQAETRIVVLEKLGLNVMEMANMLGVNKNTIHQTRLRLRKKLEKNNY